MRARMISTVIAMSLALASPGRAADRDTSWIARADHALASAQRSETWTERKRFADEVIRESETAAKRDSTDPLPQLMIAQALAISDPASSASCTAERCPAALRALERAEQLDKTGAYTERIVSERGIVLSRLQRHVEALAAYDRALTLLSAMGASVLGDFDQRPVLYGNSAETLMALGRLPEAIERYRRSAANSTTGELAWQLAMWGLAVALDRDGRVLEARAVVERVLESDPVMGSLHQTSVFFEPPGDEFYYRGLGHEIAGDRDEALDAFQRFLLALPSSRYAARARQHVASLVGGKSAPKGTSDRFEVLGVAIESSSTNPSAKGPALARTVEETTRHVKARAQEIGLCIERAERKQRLLGGILRLKMLVAATGKVLQTAVVERDAAVPIEVARCIERSAMSWRFPSLDGSAAEIVGVGLLVR